ncbi:MAG: acyl-CoA dehydrogenase family protein [Bdellovibrionia bacterium]
MSLSVENSLMKSLFFGEIREDLLFPYPQVGEEASDQLRMTLDSIERFAQDKVHSSSWDEKGAMPKEIVADLSELGVMGVAVPEEWGGLGFPQFGYARIMEEMGGIDASLATTLGAHQSIGYKALLLFGTEEQKSKYLPRLASGELIACYGLTEPQSGSDAASIQSRAVLSADGTHYVLSGSKLWITNAGIATFMTVFAKTEVLDKDGQKKEKVTCFFLELPAEGVSIGPAEHKLGIRASWTNAVYFDQVKIPAGQVIGGVGQGFKVAMGVLNHGRLGLAAGCVGGGKRALQAAIAHANERVQFQKRIGEFEMIQEKIGRMAVNLFAAESMVYMTADLMDRKTVDYSIESAIVKVFASEMIGELTDENLQIWGGAGFMKEYPYERWVRDARINRIFEGANEVLRAYIALAGMQAPGQQLAGLAEAIQHPLKGIGQVSHFAIRVMKRNLLGQSLSRPHSRLQEMTGILEEYATEFAIQVEGLLKRHGRKIALQQFVQKRVADIAIDLYAMSCILSRVTASLEQKSEAQCELELALADSFFVRANRRVRGNFKAMESNDDEGMKRIAERLYEQGKYPFDAGVDAAIDWKAGSRQK